MSMLYEIGDRIKHSWNAFRGRDHPSYAYGSANSSRPDRLFLTSGKERSTINTICTRIAVDAASVNLVHARVDANNRYRETINDALHKRLNESANKDQTGRSFRQDVYLSLLDEGCVAIVPVDTDADPNGSGSFTIESMRVGKIVEWFPDFVRVLLFNDRLQHKQEITVSKNAVAIVENPFYSIMNTPNSMFQRLVRKLALMDAIDEQSSSGKLDLIIQLPYTIRSETRKKQAEDRRKSIEEQLTGSKYGIAYTDATEHIIQLNRSLENNLMKQIEFLTSMVYGQLGLTPEILNGTASEETMLNYMERVVEPIVAAVVDEMNRKFITKTAHSQGQKLLYLIDPFKLIPATKIAEIADKFTRNAILSANEIRTIVGFKPSDSPEADKLVNRNIKESESDQPAIAPDA